MEVDYKFFQEVYLDNGDDSAEVEVSLNCDCELIRAQPDVGIFRDYLEVSGLKIDSIFLHGEETQDDDIYKQVNEAIISDFNRISTDISEGWV